MYLPGEKTALGRMEIYMFFMKSEKKKKHPLLAMAVGGMAMYGAYSAVNSMKCCCMEKMNSMMTMMKSKKKKCQASSENSCDC